MAISPVTVTFSLYDFLGYVPDVRRTKVILTTNVGSGWIADTTTGGGFRLSDAAVTIDAAGLASFSVLPSGATGLNPAEYQIRVQIDAANPATREREKVDLGWYTITAAADLKDLTAAQYVPPTYLTTVTTQLDSKVAAAETARAGAEAAEASAQALVLSDLGTTDGQTRALIENPASQTAGALAASYAGKPVIDSTDLSILMRDRTVANGVSWTTPHAAIARVLGWGIATDTQWAGGASPTRTATQNTAAIQACMASSIKAYVPAGTYDIAPLDGQSGCELIGAGRGATVLRRAAGSASNASPLSFAGKNGFAVRELTIDGNKANQTIGANNILIYSGCSNWSLERVGSVNAKTAGGYGDGIAVVDGANDTLGEVSGIRNCRVVDNDSNGISLNKEWYLLVEGNHVSRNGGSGIVAMNLVYPPIADVQDYLTITGNQCHDNGSVGIHVHGYYTAGTSDANMSYGATVPASRFVQISNNHAARNGKYGIVFQGGSGCVSGNTAVRNGSDVTNGGYLFNAWASSFIGNTGYDNSHYGVDAGGTNHCVISGNTMQNNGVTSGLGPTDINLGAAISTICSNNVVIQSGSVAGTAISAPGIDGGSLTDPFPRGGELVISNNMVTLNGVSDGHGVVVVRDFSPVVVKDNFVSGAAAANEAFVLEAGSLVQSGNIDARAYPAGSNVPIIASAATLVIPDVGETFYITGTTGITDIRTFSANTWYQKVRGVKISNQGSGYSRLSPPTVTFTGGGGTGAAGVAVVARDGTLIDVRITNSGSGYTSPPTVAFSSGVAAGTAFVGCNNSDGRVINLLFQGVLTLTDGTLRLAGNLTTAASGTILTLRGAYGQWHEVSRSTY